MPTEPRNEPLGNIGKRVVVLGPHHRQVGGLVVLLPGHEPASAHIRAGATAPPRELLSLFEAAFSNGVGLGFVYSDREGRQSQRRVEPHGLLAEPPVWYVLGRDVDKEEPRTFRMDRISRPRILTDIVFRPDITVIQAQLPDQDRWRPLIGRWAD
jgi:predicted DNA-binding transcriptional regulator YafY